MCCPDDYVPKRLLGLKPSPDVTSGDATSADLIRPGENHSRAPLTEHVALVRWVLVLGVELEAIDRLPAVHSLKLLHDLHQLGPLLLPDSLLELLVLAGRVVLLVRLDSALDEGARGVNGPVNTVVLGQDLRVDLLVPELCVLREIALCESRRYAVSRRSDAANDDGAAHLRDATTHVATCLRGQRKPSA